MQVGPPPEDNNKIHREINLSNPGWVSEETPGNTIASSNYATIDEVEKRIIRTCDLFDDMFPNKKFFFTIHKNELRFETPLLNNDKLTKEAVDDLIAKITPEVDKNSLGITVEKKVKDKNNVKLNLLIIGSEVEEENPVVKIVEDWLKKTFTDKVDAAAKVKAKDKDKDKDKDKEAGYKLVNINKTNNIYLAYTSEQYLADNLAHIAKESAPDIKSTIRPKV